MPACSGTPEPPTAPERSAYALSDQRDDFFVCEEASAPELQDLSVALDNSPSADGTVLLGDHDVLGFVIDSASAGLATLEVRLSTSTGEATLLVRGAVLDGRSASRVEVSGADAGLPVENGRFSSRLSVSAILDRADGSYAAAAPIELWLHRTGRAWLVYDAAVRDGLFSGGVLDDVAVGEVTAACGNARPATETDGPPLGTVVDAPPGWWLDDEAAPEEGEVQR